MSKEYQKLHEDYAAAAVKAKGGDKVAFTDKARIMGQIRQAERESARAGMVLNPVIRNGRLAVQTTETSSRRSLQEEYVRSFDDKVKVSIDRKERDSFIGTMREFHADRLLKRA